MPDEQVHTRVAAREDLAGAELTTPVSLIGETITDAFLRERALVLHFKSGGSTTILIPDDDCRLVVDTHA